MDTGQGRDRLDALITRDELAVMFGVSTRSIGAWRGIPRITVGAKTFYRRDDVAEWIERRIGPRLRETLRGADNE